MASDPARTVSALSSMQQEQCTMSLRRARLHENLQAFSSRQYSRRPPKEAPIHAALWLKCRGCEGRTCRSGVPASMETCRRWESRASLTFWHSSHSWLWNCWYMPGPICLVTTLFLQLHCRLPLAGLMTPLSLTTCRPALVVGALLVLGLPARHGCSACGTQPALMLAAHLLHVRAA